MKKGILIALVLVFVIGTIQTARAQGKNKSTSSADKTGMVTLAEPPVAKNWKESKEALKKLAAKFRDPQLAKAQKVELLPASNNLLYDTQQLKLSKAEKSEQIQVIVNFLAATIDSDFANSNTDSVYDDFKAHKKAYLAEIGKIKDKSIKDEILDAFDAWSEAEKDSQKSEREDEEGATVPEVEH